MKGSLSKVRRDTMRHGLSIAIGVISLGGVPEIDEGGFGIFIVDGL